MVGRHALGAADHRDVPASIALRSRSGRSSTILALVWLVSVMKPAWLPVKLSAGTPIECRAMHSSAMALRSPAVMSMSISRPGRTSDTSPARRISSSVSLPMALTTTTTSLPWRTVRATWSATSRMRSGSATDVPPYFWMTRPRRHGATLPVGGRGGRTPSPGGIDGSAWPSLVARQGPPEAPVAGTGADVGSSGQGRRALDESPPGLEPVDRVGHVGLQKCADRPQVVATDGQHPAVVVAALHDDGPDETLDGRRLGNVPRASRSRTSFGALLPSRVSARRAGPTR